MISLPFSDWEPERRIALREELDTIGADYDTTYQGLGVVIAVPVGAEDSIREIAAKHGLEWASDWQFPLGSSKPPMNLRHNSWSYGGKANCWHRARLEPKGATQ